MKRRMVAAVIAGVTVVALVFPAWAGAWSGNSFHSPTGNIHCRYFPVKKGIACISLNDNFTVGVPLRGKAFKVRNGNPRAFPAGHLLARGDHYLVTLRDGTRAFRCNMSVRGVTCRSVISSHGFFLGADTYRLF